MEYLPLLLGSLAVILSTATIWQVSKLKRRFSAALGTPSGQSLEATLSRHLKTVESVSLRLNELTASYKHLVGITGMAAQKMSVVRFNPFGDTGGDQSFALAVLDGHNSGYIITSIHGREGTRMYVKPLDYGKSKYQLSSEERQAFDQAAHQLEPAKKERAA